MSVKKEIIDLLISKWFWFGVVIGFGVTTLMRITFLGRY